MKIVKAFVSSAILDMSATPDALERELHRPRPARSSGRGGGTAGDRIQRPSLPKTRSGKIMRRLLKAWELGPARSAIRFDSGRRRPMTLNLPNRDHALRPPSPDDPHPEVRGEIAPSCMAPAKDPRLPPPLHR